MAKQTRMMGLLIGGALVSPELVMVLAALAIGAHLETATVAALPASVLREEAVKWAGLLPVTLLVYSANNWRAILSPDHAVVQILAKWPDRDRLLTTFKVGLAYQLLFAFGAVVFWTCNSLIRTRYGLPLFACCIFGSIVSVTTHYFAWINLRLLLDTVEEA